MSINPLDLECRRLAESFLQDEGNPNDHYRRDELAAHIQQAVEGWFADHSPEENLSRGTKRSRGVQHRSIRVMADRLFTFDEVFGDTSPDERRELVWRLAMLRACKTVESLLHRQA